MGTDLIIKFKTSPSSVILKHQNMVKTAKTTVSLDRRLLEQVNRAYDESPDEEEQALLDDIAAEGARVLDADP